MNNCEECYRTSDIRRIISDIYKSKIIDSDNLVFLLAKKAR